MLVFDKKANLKAYLLGFTNNKSTIGFVPTMGALHDGHLSLMNFSLQINTITVVSIFVNPTQFNNPEDLEKYPRTLPKDLEKIKNLNTEIVVYAPDVSDIYKGKTSTKSFKYDGLEHVMEGEHRPGHFDGVGTIVKKLFDIVNPTNAYFGEKDFQQLAIIKKMVEKEQLNVKIIGCPIFRETNGLAMSSRNERLSKPERQNAAVIFKTLQEAKKLFVTKSAKEVTEFVAKIFLKVEGITLEYFEIADESTLLSCVRKNKNKNYRAFIAVFVNNIRLIDNISLK